MPFGTGSKVDDHREELPALFFASRCSIQMFCGALTRVRALPVTPLINLIHRIELNGDIDGKTRYSAEIIAGLREFRDKPESLVK